MCFLIFYYLFFHFFLLGSHISTMPVGNTLPKCIQIIFNDHSMRILILFFSLVFSLFTYLFFFVTLFVTAFFSEKKNSRFLYFIFIWNFLFLILFVSFVFLFLCMLETTILERIRFVILFFTHLLNVCVLPWITASRMYIILERKFCWNYKNVFRIFLTIFKDWLTFIRNK